MRSWSAALTAVGTICLIPIVRREEEEAVAVAKVEAKIASGAIQLT